MERSELGDGKRAMNIAFPEALVAEAERLGVDVSQAAEHGLSAEVARARANRWVERNRQAMESWNDYVERNGLPLEDLQQLEP